MFVVLSPCERLREKNEAAALKYGKGTFIPACEKSGAWQSVQCMAHIGTYIEKLRKRHVFFIICANMRQTPFKLGLCGRI